MNPNDIETSGQEGVTSGGHVIPSEIRLKNLYAGPHGEDKIIIKKESGGVYRILLSEEAGGRGGGGVFSNSLDQFAEQKLGKKEFPCKGHDKEKEADIYSIEGDDLSIVLESYYEKIGYSGRRITGSQKRARQANAGRARKVLKENRENNRKRKWGIR